MTKIKLDKIDKKILRNLQDSGRMTNVELARIAGISAPPCLRRVKALEESGFIKGYHANIDASALGYGITVFAMVSLKSQAEKDVVAFETAMTAHEQVRSCHLLAGDIDFILKIVAKDWDDYQVFLSEHLTSAPNVQSVRSMLNIRSAKTLPGVPITE
jgi:DNA-binding Lrp family transcriptional regulator